MKHSSIKSPDNIEFTFQPFVANRTLKSHYNQIKTIYSVLIIALSLSVGYARDITHLQPVEIQESNPRSIISFLPIYMAVNAIRIDYDISLTPQHWIQIAPALYLRNNRMNGSTFGSDFLHLKGAGLHLYHRFYPGGKNFDRSNVYISYGPIYQHLYFTYMERNDNVESERYTRLERLGGDIIIGVTAPIFDRLFLDFYAGMGLRYAFVQSNAARPKRFNYGMGAYGYSGNTLIIGLRLSVPFK